MILFLEVVLFVIVVLICGFLSAAGKAINTVNRNDIRKLADDGDRRAQRLTGIFEDRYRLLATVQVVVTFAGLLIGGVLAYSSVASFSEVFSCLDVFWARVAAMVIMMVVASCIFLVLARIYPQQIAMQHTEGVALALSGYARFFLGLCRPFVAISNGFTNMVLVMTRQQTGISDEGFSEEDVMSMLEVGQETGEIKEEGKKMINSIFEFDDKLAYEIMTPRTDVFAIDINDEPSEYLDKMMEMRYSRIPVYDDDSDNIIGILNIKDYMRKAWQYGFDSVYIEKILREPFFVPDSKNIDSLFFELQKQRQHIAILIDEYGGFTGIVTMEDIIEEVMGDIDDEYDEAEPQVEKVSEDTFYIDGAMDLDDVNEETGAQLESENSETVGGLLTDIMGEIPDDNDHCDRKVEYENYLFTIESVKDRRLERIKMQILPKTAARDEDNDDEKQDDGAEE